jgi:hypothetical protein
MKSYESTAIERALQYRIVLFVSRLHTVTTTMDSVATTMLQAQNKTIFKQLLQEDAIEFCQIDSCRVAGPTEIFSVLLMAVSSARVLLAVSMLCSRGVGLDEHT